MREKRMREITRNVLLPFCEVRPLPIAVLNRLSWVFSLYLIEERGVFIVVGGRAMRVAEQSGTLSK